MNNHKQDAEVASGIVDGGMEEASRHLQNAIRGTGSPVDAGLMTASKYRMVQLGRAKSAIELAINSQGDKLRAEKALAATMEDK